MRKVAFYTLGCKVNQYETNAIREQFLQDGFTEVPFSQSAEVYVINSCTVTAGADSKTRQILRRFRRQNPKALIALCGCFPQAFPESAKELPEADILMGSTHRRQLLEIVKEQLKERQEKQCPQKIVNITPHAKGEIFEPLRVSSFGPRTRAFVKIQDGCQRFCSYCIIPFARGPVRSKPIEDIISELTTLGENGYKEVVLVGINLSCYGTELGLGLIDAVQAACHVPGIQRVRLGSLEPELLSQEDIQRMAKLKGFCPQFHLSLQSGSDSVLERMRRPYTLTEYRRIVKDLRKAFPDAAITTDIMVGFPGETQKEHQQSLDFVQEIGLARAHVFVYSPRPGTRAAKMPHPVPEDIKAQRSEEMIAVTHKTQRTFLAQQIGLVEEVLFETQGDSGWWEGYTKNYTLVRVHSKENLEGCIAPVVLQQVEGQHCVGILAKEQ